jgi:hypothetical protein
MGLTDCSQTYFSGYELSMNSAVLKAMRLDVLERKEWMVVVGLAVSGSFDCAACKVRKLLRSG